MSCTVCHVQYATNKWAVLMSCMTYKCRSTKDLKIGSYHCVSYVQYGAAQMMVTSNLTSLKLVGLADLVLYWLTARPPVFTLLLRADLATPCTTTFSWAPRPPLFPDSPQTRHRPRSASTAAWDRQPRPQTSYQLTYSLTVYHKKYNRIIGAIFLNIRHVITSRTIICATYIWRTTKVRRTFVSHVLNETYIHLYAGWNAD
jgi:hypothetical protein